MLVDAISEGVQTAMTPERWKVYDRLFLVDPPKELAYYRDLETIDFDASFDEMRRAAKRTPLASISLIVQGTGTVTSSWRLWLAVSGLNGQRRALACVTPGAAPRIGELCQRRPQSTAHP